MLELGPAAGNMDNLAAVASAVPDTGTAAESVAVDTVALDIAAVDTAGSPLEFHTEPVILRLVRRLCWLRILGILRLRRRVGVHDFPFRKTKKQRSLVYVIAARYTMPDVISRLVYVAVARPSTKPQWWLR